MTRRLAWACALVLATPAAFGDTPPPQNVVGLTASATAEATKDLLSVTLSTTRDGADAATVQAGLKQALDAAWAEAKRAAKPGQIDVRTGNFSLFPRYAPKAGITGWQGSAQLVVEGRDIPGIAQLTGRIKTLTIANVSTDLSRQQRENLENEVASQAIATYKTKAADYARNFGFTGFTLREVNVNSDVGSNQPVPLMRMSAAKADAEATLPVELGRGSVTVTVNGTVQLIK
jgi:predicted secreted protein